MRPTRRWRDTAAGYLAGVRYAQPLGRRGRVLLGVLLAVGVALAAAAVVPFLPAARATRHLTAPAPAITRPATPTTTAVTSVPSSTTVPPATTIPAASVTGPEACSDLLSTVASSVPSGPPPTTATLEAWATPTLAAHLAAEAARPPGVAAEKVAVPATVTVLTHSATLVTASMSLMLPTGPVTSVWSCTIAATAAGPRVSAIGVRS